MPEWLKALWQALVYLVIAAIALFLGRWIYRIIRKVELPQAEMADAEWERVKAERLAEAVDTGLSRIDSGTATDAVIACWVALEEAAASAGVARDPSETPAEFTVRVLGVGGISEPQLNRLGELYREARYSTHGSIRSGAHRGPALPSCGCGTSWLSHTPWRCRHDVVPVVAVGGEGAAAGAREAAGAGRCG